MGKKEKNGIYNTLYLSEISLLSSVVERWSRTIQLVNQRPRVQPSQEAFRHKMITYFTIFK